MSNKEIAELWKRTTAEARKQRGLQLAQVQAQTDLGIGDEEFYIDSWGNRIEGKKAAPKTSGHYVDSAGYVVELAPGEKPPESTGTGLTDWLKTVDIENDTEVREALGPQLFFEERLNDTSLWLIGRLENNGWLVTVKNEIGDSEYKFRLAKRLSRDEAISQARGYAESKLGPPIRYAHSLDHSFFIFC